MAPEQPEESIGPPLESVPAPAGPASSESPRPGPSPAAVWLLTLAAGLTAGLGAWWAVESVYGRYQPTIQTQESTPNPAAAAVRDRNLRRAMIAESSLAFGALGGLLGLTFGMAGGLARGAFRAGLAAAAIGLALGAAGGLAAGRLLAPLQYRLSTSIHDDVAVAALVQGAICAVVGALAGAAFSLGLGEHDERLDPRIVAGGLLGAAAGLIVYQIAGVLAFPLDDTTRLISNTWSTRLLARGLVAGFAAVGVILAVTASAPARRPGPPPTP